MAADPGYNRQSFTFYTRVRGMAFGVANHHRYSLKECFPRATLDDCIRPIAYMKAVLMWCIQIVSVYGHCYNQLSDDKI